MALLNVGFVPDYDYVAENGLINYALTSELTTLNSFDNISQGPKYRVNFYR